MKRVYLSSTCYDLHDIRVEIEALLQDYGFDVLNSESPDFPIFPGYHSHDICIAAVDLSDIFILIIDRRYGGTYAGTMHEKKDISITWYEYLRASEQGKIIYVFCRENVWNERATFNKSPDKTSFSPFFVDSIRVFDFINEIVHSHHDNWITKFSDSLELKTKLLAKIAPIYKKIDVSFYNNIPLQPHNFIEIPIWTKRPSLRYSYKDRFSPNALEDLEAMHIVSGKSKFITKYLYNSYTTEDGYSLIAPIYVYPISGFIESIHDLGDYIIIELGINENQWNVISQPFENFDKLPQALFYSDAIYLLKAQEDIKTIIKTINVIKKRAFPGDHEKQSSYVEIEKVLQVLIQSKIEWSNTEVFDDNQNTEDLLFFVADTAKSLPKDTISLIFDIIWSFSKDGRRNICGTVADSAIAALSSISELLNEEQLELIQRWKRNNGV